MAVPTPREILAQNRRDALAMAEKTGVAGTRVVLERAEADLVRRLAGMNLKGGQTFTRVQMDATLAQIRDVIRGVGAGMTGVLVDNAGRAATAGAEGTVDYLKRAERLFRGTSQPLALDTARMFDRASQGAKTSILRRLASSGTPEGEDATEHKAKPGILERYGMSTIGDFEQELQTGVLARRSWDDQKAAIVGKSPFLQGKPGFWAERIVRTESMGALQRGSWEANREANDQLGDMLKIVSATFDDRTGSDSFAVHGQIRRPDEAFESWFGLYQHPPNRPNDREVVVPHRMSWPIPEFLRWKTDAEISARWVLEKRKGTPPKRPTMTTVDMGIIGKQQPPAKDKDKRDDE